MKIKIILLTILFIQLSNGQTQIGNPVSKIAFDSIIIKDLNFMVLGDDNIKQGIAYEYKNDNSELLLSGNLYNKNGKIVTIDGKFTSDNSVFIFDNKDGSKKGKLNVNIFLNGFGFLNAKNYIMYSESDTPKEKIIVNEETLQAILKNYLDRLELAKTTYTSIMQMEYIMSLLNLPYNSITDDRYSDIRLLINQNCGIIGGFDYSIINYKTDVSNHPELVKKIKEYNKALVSNTIANLQLEINALTTTTYQWIDNDSKLVDQKSIPNGFRIDKLLKDYKDALKKLENYPSEMVKSESENIKKYWTKHNCNYFGISPFYERQGIDIYTPTTDNLIEFKDRFNEVRSDSYGLSLNWNYIQMWKDNSFLIFRVLGGCSRSNNFIEYKKKEYKFTIMTESINGIPIESTTTQTGYTNLQNRQFKYGFTRETSLEFYAALPFIGFFGKLGVKDNNALIATESYPMETGILINLKSKEKKNIVAVQFFIRRENLKTHPDDDSNFGLRVGLPINLRSN